MVPNGWSNKCIDDYIIFSGGSQPPREVFKFEPCDNHIRLIQIRDYKTDKYATYVPKSLAKKFCSTSDVMIGRYGPPIFQILRGIEGAYNVALIKAIPKAGLDQEFMYYFLSQEPLLKVIESYSQRTSGQTGIEMDILKAYPMPLPPLSEQQKIAEILSTWDQAISATEKLLENSQQQKKALMQQLLTGKKRLLDENGVTFSEQWKYLKANELFASTSKKQNSEDEELLAVTQDQGVIPRSLLERRVVMPEGSTSGYKLVVPGNFIISLRSFQGGLEYSCYRGLVSPAYTVLKSVKEICDDFYKHYYKSYDFIGHLAVAVIGIRDGKQISYEDFSFLKLPYPRIAEQEKIAKVLSLVDQEIETLQKKLNCLKQEKKALMQQLLTGKKRVKVAA